MEEFEDFEIDEDGYAIMFMEVAPHQNGKDAMDLFLAINKFPAISADMINKSEHRHAYALAYDPEKVGQTIH